LLGLWPRLGRFDEAIEELGRAREIDPSFAAVQVQLAEIYRRKGDSGRALAVLEQLPGNSPHPWVGYLYGITGRKREAETVLAALENESKKHYVSPQSFAIVHMGLGNKEQALNYLEKAYEERSFFGFPGSERWNVLRSEPRFQDIQCRMGLPIRNSIDDKQGSHLNAVSTGP
jgi:tetratricopeptide (TPR) repeat protein